MDKKTEKQIVDTFWKALNCQPFFTPITDEYIKNAKNTFFQEEELSYPDGTFRIITNEVAELLHKISEAYLGSERDFARKVNFNIFHRAFKNELGAYLNNHPKNIIDEDGLVLISKARTKLEQKFESITYFFPLIFFDTIEVEKFNIGSVEIINQKIFNEYKQEIIESVFDKDEVTEQEIIEWENSPFTALVNKNFKTLSKQEKFELIKQTRDKNNLYNKEAIDSVCNNKWVIKIPVGACHPDISRKTAKSVAEQSINILKIIFTESHADKLEVVEFSKNNKGNYITQHEDNTFYISHSSEAKDQLADGWYEYMKPYSFILSEFAIILDNHLQFKPIDEYQFRIWEAVQWYISSFSDEAVGMKINKYCNAIERLVLSGESGNGITKRFTERAALLAAIDKTEYNTIIDKFKKFYGARSDYSHGRISHNQYSNKISLYDAIYLSREVILRSILFYQGCLKKEAPISTNSIKRAFDNALKKFNK